MTLREYADAIRKGDDPLAVLRVAVSEAESSALERAAALFAREATYSGLTIAARLGTLKSPTAAPAAEPSEHVAPAGGAQPPDPEGDRNRHNAMLVEAWREEFATLCKVLFPCDDGPIGWKHVQAKVKALADGVEGKT